jgi:hypothetical protein
MKTLIFSTLMLVAGASGLARSVQACDHCDRCGCESNCCKTCRLICETKKVPKITYDCICEDFCVPGPSDHCVVCDECGKKKHVYTPTCAKVKTRKVLVKKETFTEVPSYRWVVENCCGACANQAAAETAENQQKLSMTRGTGEGVAPASVSASADAQPLSTASELEDRPKGDLSRRLGSIFGQK